MGSSLLSVQVTIVGFCTWYLVALYLKSKFKEITEDIKYNLKYSNPLLFIFMAEKRVSLRLKLKIIDLSNSLFHDFGNNTIDV